MALANSLAAQVERKTFSAFVGQDAIKNKINQMVGGKDGQRFITSIISAVSINPALSECEHFSIISAAMLGESLKLSPSPQLGQYYLVPFENKKKGTKEAQFILGYKGYIQLAIRSGYYRKINVVAIKEGELVSYNPLDEEIKVNLIENDMEREALPTIGYYAMFEYQNGFIKAMYWSIEKMIRHADTYSKAFSAASYQKLKANEIPATDMWKYSSFWYKDFDGMAFKTMLRQLISKWGIMSIELQNAIEKDEAVADSGGNYQFVDNVEDVTAATDTAQKPAEIAPGITEADPAAEEFFK